MSPQRSGRLAYWHAGGAIETRSGPITPQRAAALCRFLAEEALASVLRGDLAAGAFCARTSQEVADAIVECEAWRRSAAL
jgi:hypothetical protein